MRARIISLFVLICAAYLPTFIWMCKRFTEPGSYYAHGFLIPLVSLILLWRKKEELKKIPVSSSMFGLVLLLFGLFVHLIALRFKIDFVSGFSLIVVLTGTILYLLGRKHMEAFLFPVLFLGFMVPLPTVFTTPLSFRMKMFAASAATFFANKIHIPAIQEGSTILMPFSSLTVGDPCSGLKSLISLLALGAIVVYLMRTSLPRKTLLFLMTIPLALAANIVRILFLILVAYVYGSKVATGKFLEGFAGLLVFVLAFAGLLTLGSILCKKSKLEQIS